MSHNLIATIDGEQDMVRPFIDILEGVFEGTERHGTLNIDVAVISVRNCQMLLTSITKSSLTLRTGKDCVEQSTGCLQECLQHHRNGRHLVEYISDNHGCRVR